MIYSAAVSTHATAPEQARRFVELMSGARTRVMRTQVGFEAAPAAAPDSGCMPLVGAGLALAQGVGDAASRMAGFFR